MKHICDSGRSKSVGRYAVCLYIKTLSLKKYLLLQIISKQSSKTLLCFIFIILFFLTVAYDLYTVYIQIFKFIIYCTMNVMID